MSGAREIPKSFPHPGTQDPSPTRHFLLLRWLHIVAIILLTGTIFSLRCLVIPALAVLAPEERTRLMGRLMARTRPTLWASSILFFVSSLLLAIRQSGTGLLPVVKLTLSALLLLTVFLIAIPPHRTLAPRLLPIRERLLEVALALALLTCFWL